jgi:hypothetical protein
VGERGKALFHFVKIPSDSSDSAEAMLFKNF